MFACSYRAPLDDLAFFQDESGSEPFPCRRDSANGKQRDDETDKETIHDAASLADSGTPIESVARDRP
jgi:hypothetical protein